MESCPYCRETITETNRTVCPACHTPHHHDCWDENGGCTVFGCTSAPADEPKIGVSPSELNRAAGSVAPVFGGGGATYFVVRNGAQTGPFTLEQLRRQSSLGEITPNTLAWTSGLPNWLPLWQILQSQSVASPFLSPQLGDDPSDPCPGIPRFGRLWYLGSLIGLLFLWGFIKAAAKGSDEANSLAVLIFMLGWIPIAVLRLRDIGMNEWFVIFGFIPIANLFIWFRLLLAPRGYERTKKADVWLRAMSWIFAALVVLVIIIVVIGAANGR